MTVVGRKVLAGVLGAGVVLAAGGCSLFQKDDTESVSVFDVKIGDCFTVPQDAKKIATDLATLPRVDCATPHEQESYALEKYTDPGTDTAPENFPGAAALKAFADGRCAEKFAGYVGVDYRDSELYFTYLVPSPRSWEKDADRTTICFITTTGEDLTRSVKQTGW